MKYWIQKNLRSEEDIEQLQQAIKASGAESELFNLIPFDTEFPKSITFEEPFCLLGSTTLIKLSYNHPVAARGIHFAPALFKPSVYAARYGKLYINSDAQIRYLHSVDQLKFDPEELVFVRSDSDMKDVTGGVMPFKDVLAMKAAVKAGERFDSTGFYGEYTPVAVCAPKKIEAEWRFVIVNQKPVAGCLYRPYRSEGAPEEVRDFARFAARVFSPSEVYVLDICAQELDSDMGEYYVMECNCFNASGLYKMDHEAVFKAVTDWYQQK